MPILNYTTNIDYDKTIAEITKLLVANGARKIVADYGENKLPIGLTFCLEVNGNIRAFSLPCNYSGVLKAMKNNKKVPNSRCNEAQALRVSWRIVKDWVAAQLAIVEAQLADMAEVFLPYAVTRNGNTMYKELKEGNYNQLLLD